MAPLSMAVQFRVRYWTEWGQNLVICGADPRLGGWDPRKGVWMQCQHVGDNELLWVGRVQGVFAEPFEYRYAVVDADRNLVRWDALTHTADFAPVSRLASRSGDIDRARGRSSHRAGAGLSTVTSHGSAEDSGGSGGAESSGGSSGGGGGGSGGGGGGRSSKGNSKSGAGTSIAENVEVQDTWEFQSHPENLFLRKAFRDVVNPQPASAAAARSPTRAASPAATAAVAEVAKDLTSAVAALALEATGMSVRLRLEVRALRLLPGQQVHATGSCAALGGWDRDLAAAMELDEEARTWHLELDIARADLPVRYKYALKGGPAHDVLESGVDRVVAPHNWSDGRADISLAPGTSGAARGGAAGGGGGGRGGGGGKGGRGGDGKMSGSGSGNGSGEEDRDSAGTTRPTASGPDGNGWTVFNPAALATDSPFQPGSPSALPFQFPPSPPTHTHFPPPPPYRPPTPPLPPGPELPSRIVTRDGHFRHPGVWRGSGLAVPVFSLRSRHSVGAGDFGDLKMLVDVAAAAGMTVVQLLPVNDTTVHGMWWDSYPYSSVSVIALHPLYLRLQPLVAAGAALAAFEGNAGNSTLFAGLQAEVARAAATLDTKEVDYEATMRVKMSVARRCFDATRTAFLSSPALVAFLEENQEWLKPYAVFRVLADVFGTAQHWRWGTMGAGDAAAVVSRLSAPDSHLFPAVAAHYYVQFHLHHQLLAAAAHAQRRGVVLKGDLPIGVDKASVDTWTHPELFRMDTSTGAPPDGFDPNGQNWGFPTYNWDNMAKDGYAWWRGRMTHLERYFSAMRVDHVLGFFRIWELPGHTRTGRMGRFRPSLPVRRSELDARGLWFIDRLCDPHITARLLKETFQDRDGEVAGRFLDKSGSCQLSDGSSTTTYCFKPDFATEEGLLESDAFKVRGGSPDWLVAETAAMRAGLLHLQHNVCLLRDPLDPDAFYPRIEMDKTHSFQELQDWARHGLSWLYDDYFHHRQDALWRENARRTLPALMTCTGQLVCGEDLGMVPPCVPPVLEELGILGLRIQRMPHAEGDGNGDRSGDGGGDGEGGGDGGGGGGGVKFGRPGGYPYQTVCSPSCHDTSTTRAWYEADAGRRARYARGVLGMTGDGRLASEFPPPMSYRAERVEEGSGSSEKRRTSAGSVGAADLMGVVGIVDCDGIVIEDTGLGGGGGGMGGGGRGAGGDGSGSQHPQHPPPDKCEPQVMRAIIRQHMASPSVLAVFPVQDLLALAGEYAQRPAEEETINDPTNPRHYWRFRMHVRLEDLLGNAAWLADIRQLVNEAGRAPVRSAGGRVSDAADT